jgi:hypothetical protein
MKTMAGTHAVNAFDLKNELERPGHFGHHRIEA